MAEGLIFDIKRYAIHDGPGIRTTVFLKGCPLTCWWCDNPESQSREREFTFWPDRCLGCDACIEACTRDAVVKDDGGMRRIEASRCDFCMSCVEECYPGALQAVGRRIDVDALLDEVEKDLDFYRASGGGVTFSGGEPLSQPEFLQEILAACKGRGLHTAVDTCGYASWAIIKKVAPYVDLFLYDVKLMDEEKHRRYTGVSNRLILSNLRRLAGANRVVVRMPLVPGINDDRENTRRLGEFLSGLEGIEGVDLLPYHRLGVSKYERVGRRYVLNGTESPAPVEIEAVRDTLERAGLRVRIGG
ncbi:MAG: glycyl-radical enzyme activating protein [Deltaproteobacteria bacterium]|nr:glycyl-radical enzyme activating protein [Deltaproteobacteria bacterium]MBW2122494.1 glycyl-radical enzyme activating protein [Deltaproteobacteria bacterium]